MLDVTAPNMLSKQLMLFAIANICTWCFLGYNMLIYYSALIGIPNDLYESAVLTALRSCASLGP